MKLERVHDSGGRDLKRVSEESEGIYTCYIKAEGGIIWGKERDK